jgi:hypothetical protein
MHTFKLTAAMGTHLEMQWKTALKSQLVGHVVPSDVMVRASCCFHKLFLTCGLTVDPIYKRIVTAECKLLHT